MRKGVYWTAPGVGHPKRDRGVIVVQPQQQVLVRDASYEIRCVECDRVAQTPAAGWKAFIGGGYEGEPLAVIVFCPNCALREVGVPAE
jgi:hypothetical protein